MREIKYRVWDGERMRYPCELPNMVNTDYFMVNREFEEHDGCMIETCPPNYGGPYEVEEWMQYTGLKDKNGLEIYEGDILCIDYPKVEKVPEELRKGLEGAIVHPSLVYGRDAYTEKKVIKIPSIYQLDLDTTEYYIGGNIYENPELQENSPL